MRILFVHPKIPARFNGMPYGLLQVATTAKNLGHEVTLADFQANDSLPSVEKLLLSVDPDVVAIASTSPSHAEAVRLAKTVRSMAPNTTIIKGGIHETYCGKHTIANVPDIDYVLRGEVDHTIGPFLHNLQFGGPLESIPGIVLRNGEDIYSHPTTPSVPLNDDLPLVDRSILGSTSYDFRVFGGLKTTQVQTMRGCPFPCVFCNQRNRVRITRSAPHVTAELATLYEQGYRAIFFDDATFTVNRQYTMSLMNHIIDSGLSFRFGGQTRASLLDDELCDTMRRAGFTFLSFGLETTNEEALKTFMKSRSPSQHISHSINAVLHCKNNGIQVATNLIVGFDSDTRDSVLRSFEFTKSLEPDYVSLSALALYPHERSGLEDDYLSGVSTESVWNAYDEGYGAVHPHLSPDQAAEYFTEAVSIFGDLLEVT